MTVQANASALAVRSVEDRTAEATLRLAAVVAQGIPGRLEWHRPGPSAAFSRRDSLAPGFPTAVDTVRAHGFEPFIRPVGGQLAAYHRGALVLDLLLPCADPRAGTTARFRALADVLTLGLRLLGVDARTGAVPGEYCPGQWSVNARGTRKLVGTGQRLVRNAVLLTAVVVVGDADPLRAVMTHAYADLGVSMDPRTVGSVSDEVPGVTLSDVEGILGEALAQSLPLEDPDLRNARLFTRRWDPR